MWDKQNQTEKLRDLKSVKHSGLPIKNKTKNEKKTKDMQNVEYGNVSNSTYLEIVFLSGYIWTIFYLMQNSIKCLLLLWLVISWFVFVLG